VFARGVAQDDVVALGGDRRDPHRVLERGGRVLFARSRANRTTRNDADRLRKYLARFGLDFESIRR